MIFSYKKDKRKALEKSECPSTETQLNKLSARDTHNKTLPFSGFSDLLWKLGCPPLDSEKAD